MNAVATRVALWPSQRNRVSKQKLRQGDMPAAAVDDYSLLVKGHESDVPSLIRYSLFSVSSCDSGSLLEARNIVLGYDVRIARRDSTLAGRVRVDGLRSPIWVDG